LDSSSTWPALGALEANGLAPLARKMELFSSATQPSRIGLGSISGAPAPVGRIWKSMRCDCAADPEAAAAAAWPRRALEPARWPSTVPAITVTPTCSGRR
jgi:hypothetical protein